MLGRVLLVCLVLSPPCLAAETTVSVVDASGQPVAGAEVTLHVGWTRYALTPGFDRWFAVETKKGTTAADGRCAFSGLPAGTVATAYVKTAQAVGVARGAGDLQVKLGAFGALKGKVLGKRQELKALRIWVRGGHGLGSGEATVDKKKGTFVVEGLTPGPARIFLKASNFDVARRDVELVAGKTAKAKAFKYRGKFAPSADPLVDCLKVKLIDSNGQPVPDVQLIWSSRWMDGGMNSDADGVVKLAGGAVAIGGPPYLLRLQSLKGKRAVFQGMLGKVKRGVAIVELQLLLKVDGTVKRGGAALDKYRLLVVGEGTSPRVYIAGVEEGKFTLTLPAGRCRVVVGTADGKFHEQQVAFTASRSSYELALK